MAIGMDAGTAAPQSEAPRPLAGLFVVARRVLICFAIVSAALAVVKIAGALALHHIMAGGFVPDGLLDGVDFVSLLLAVTYLALFIASIVMVCRFTFRAMKNLRLAGEQTDMSPGWAVGWYFIPIASLFMPYLGMSEIWTRSRKRAGVQGRGAHLGWWWATFVGGSILGNIATRLVGWTGDAEIGAIIASFWIDAVTFTVLAVSAMLLKRVMAEVTTAQDAQPD
ncbi:MAG: DUF4328 domain-containing protein [Oceanicaulis sp.]